MDINLPAYYDRSEDEIAKGYERHLFRAGHVLQSAELNELQGLAAQRHRMLGDAIFKDGDIVRDARLVVDSATGQVIAESGAIYLDGAVRGVPPAEFTIPVTGTVVIGIYLTRTVITEQEDPTLADPAIETQAYGEPGAGRLKVEPSWGVQGEHQDVDFFPIYYVDEGQLRAKEAPPVMDAVTQAIARYDIDSSGSNYVVEGMRVRRLADQAGEQIYNIDEGRARVNGFGITLANSRRLAYAAEPVIKLINSEPTNSSSATLQHVTFARPPARDIVQVNITAERTVTVTHSSVAGGSDPLPDTSVVSIVSVVQGGTTFEYGDDYVLTGQTVDWSPSGNEPAPGSSYDVTYRHITQATPQNVTDRGFDVAGAVPGTLILTTYNTMLPRIDRLCIDDSGQFVWLQGVSTDFNPVRPAVPPNLIALAQITQRWDESTQVINDGVRTVPMRDIEAMNARMELLTDLVAQQLLISDLNTREAGTKKGIFTDPFLNDDQRDAGIAQDAAVVGGILTLPILPDVGRPTDDLEGPQTCAYTVETIVAQNERTGSMKVNPYMAFDVPQAPAVLDPAVDRWTEVETQWLSTITERFIAYHPSFHLWVPRGGHPFWTNDSTTIDTISSTQSDIEYLRQIEVKFTITGFGPGEELTSVTFDGIPVTPTA